MTRDEHIPPTPEWIKQQQGRVEVVTDSKGNVLHARTEDNSILAYLIKREVLDETAHYYAMMLLDMRNCFRRKVGYASNSIYALEFFGGGGGMLETFYLRVCNRIKGRTEKLVNYTIETPADDKNWPLAWIERHDIRDAFARLEDACIQVRKEAEERKEIEPRD